MHNMAHHNKVYKILLEQKTVNNDVVCYITIDMLIYILKYNNILIWPLGSARGLIMCLVVPGRSNEQHKN